MVMNGAIKCCQLFCALLGGHFFALCFVGSGLFSSGGFALNDGLHSLHKGVVDVVLVLSGEEQCGQFVVMLDPLKRCRWRGWYSFLVVALWRLVLGNCGVQGVESVDVVVVVLEEGEFVGEINKVGLYMCCIELLWVC